MQRDKKIPMVREMALKTAPVKAKTRGPVDTDSIALLRSIMEGLGVDSYLAGDADKEDVARTLGSLVGKEWTGKYVHNILTGAVDASVLFRAAMRIQAGLLDGMPEYMARAKPMQLMVTGEVHPNALVTASSKRCENPGCRIRFFIPRVGNQVYCTDECRKAHRKLKRMLAKE